jgi:hypothetical protein
MKKEQTKTSKDREEEDGAVDGVKNNGFSGSRDFLGDWFGYFRFYCFHSLLCCFPSQRQACVLIHLSSLNHPLVIYLSLSVHALGFSFYQFFWVFPPP